MQRFFLELIIGLPNCIYIEEHLQKNKREN